MNSEILTGKWNELKGKVKETFGRLTDDDLMQVEGSSDRVVGLLQQRYGYSKDQAQREWDNFYNSYQNNATDTANDLADTAKNKLHDLSQGAAKVARDLADKVEKAVR